MRERSRPPAALSVVIPCTRPFVVERLLAALTQPLADGQTAEVFVVGDVANAVETRGSWRVETVACAERHPNTRRNRGLDRARGERVAFLDDDTYPEPGWVKAALSLEPDANQILVGPELPFTEGFWSRLIYSLCQNPWVEYSRGHTRRPRGAVKWYHAPFCNMVMGRRLLETIGYPSEMVPWDMDDMEFCYRAKGKAAFFHEPALLARHDRYPNSPKAFLAYRWRQRVRLGEKMVTHFRYYRGMPMALISTFLPWFLLAAAWAAPFSIGTEALAGGCFYVVFLVGQAFWVIGRGGTSTLLPTLGMTVALHAIALIGVQYGMVRQCVLGHKKKP